MVTCLLVPDQKRRNSPLLKTLVSRIYDTQNDTERPVNTELP